MAEVFFPTGAGGLSLLHSVETGTGVHPSSYPTGFGDSSTELERPGREADHISPSNAEVKNDGATAPHRHTPLWHGA
jgi:hypothetical protein